VNDKTKPVTGDWSDAARKSEQSWDKQPDKVRDAPEQSIEESMERTEEGYGSGKDGADPAADHDGTTPAKSAG
jgi:hypothetical protein